MSSSVGGSGPKLEGVATNGKCNLKSVLAPAPASANSSSAGATASCSAAAAGARTIAHVKRLDGSIEEVPIGVPPSNPNFKPRETVWSGKVVTSDKLEVQLRFYERKGMPLTAELEAKKAELIAAGTYERPGGGSGPEIYGRQGGKKKGKGGGGGGKSGGGGGSKGSSAAAAAPPAAPLPVAPEVSAWYRNRPKGGVKVLGGAEGAVGSKRSANGEAPEGEPAAKK